MAHFRTSLMVIGVTLISNSTFAQIGWVTVKHGTLKAIPMKNAAVTSDQYRGFKTIDYFPSLIFTSKCDSVFSLVNGVVIGISSQNEEGRVFIKVTDSLCYNFLQLKYVASIEDQVVKKGDFIGLADKSGKENLFAMKLQIISGILSFEDEAEMWKMVQKNN